MTGPELLGIPIDFVLFGLTLVGVVVWLLITTAIVIRVAIGVFAARRMSPEQAQLILNDTIWIEHRREVHRVARYSARERLRRSRTRDRVNP